MKHRMDLIRAQLSQEQHVDLDFSRARQPQRTDGFFSFSFFLKYELTRHDQSSAAAGDQAGQTQNAIIPALLAVLLQGCVRGD